MGNKDAIIDLDTLDLSQVVADLDEIRRYNPQRFEMEQLSGIVYENPESHICVGFKDVGRDEFWIRGHMPGMPLMPGVVMCEAAAQLSSYFAVKYDMLGSGFVVGLGGLEEVRIRESVYPGDRMYVVCQLVRVRRGKIIICRFEGYARNRIVVEGIIKGIPLPGSQGAQPS
ncbi:MAG: beta-hydroxyacyl-ACP dehydratase [Planctomycetota bacterium]|nr:beta-hydroxyacyl-ACP dehydratase [Planctomycetota bacterium]MDA1180591.1 beta-hydroxyacyl-ACP dehydratase [Planctomycetota bacterium]